MNSPTTNGLYLQYIELLQKIADLRFSGAILQWDQETYLPPKGAHFRARQVATLSELAHDWFTSDRLGDLLTKLEETSGLDETQQSNIRRTREDYTRQRKFTPAFVRKLTEATQASFHSWVKARNENRFALFAPELSRLVDLKREEAAQLGYENHPYDALLDDYDKNSTSLQLDQLFDSLRNPLKELLDKIMARPEIPDSFLKKNYPKQAQWNFGNTLIRQLGYDLEAGRQDLAEHPFSISFNNQDVRITTRIDENDLSNMIWSSIHEVGHALYEQGLPTAGYGLPQGEAASYSIHESQSRLWENQIGRSLAFCSFLFPQLQQLFPVQLADVDTHGFYCAINKVQPSLIRTEADELTYHFHVMIRYELEKALIEGSIQVKDIPEFWNSSYKKYLGITVPDDKQGCLQDVHWSHGSFGYFPTYSQGSFYAAQFYASAEKAIPALKSQVQSGNFTDLLGWLRKEIHPLGRRYYSAALCEQVTGAPPSTQYFLDQLLAKYRNIYQF